jgi:site-specific DNA-methyltransferase (adenine-specific)
VGSREFNAILEGDCLEGLRTLPEGCVDLAFADPPFNIGYQYDLYNDRRRAEDYLSWTREWLQAVARVLKPDGTLWVAIGDEYAAELKVLAQREVGFTTRSWVIWYYTFGVNCTENFSRSHTHLFYFVKDPNRFTFNHQEIRVPSARQLVYTDSRANPSGRLPDNTWILRPQDAHDAFEASEDTWYFPRVAGTFKERAGFHGCQMPEQLLGRIIRACSHPDELVLDPFAGSGTTLAVAKKLGRRWLGFELSPEYASNACERVQRAVVGAPLEGAPEPIVSAPPTGRLSSRLYLRSAVERALIEAFVRVAGRRGVRSLLNDLALANAFADECRELGLPGDDDELCAALLNIDDARRFEARRRKRRKATGKTSDKAPG